MRPTSILLAAACAHGGWSCRSITPASVRRERSCVVLAAPYPAAEEPKFNYRKPPPSKQPPPSRRSVTSPRFPQDAQAEAKERAEAFSDPSRRINQAVRDSSLPLRTELLRTRLPAAHPHGQSAAWAVPELGSCTSRETADGSEQLETPRARSRAIERPATNASAARASRLQTRRFHRVRPCRRTLRRSLCTPAQWTRSTRSRWWSVRCYTHVHAPVPQAVHAPLLYILWLHLQGALLALTDGKLADMQAAAEVDGGVQQLNAAIESAQALGRRRGDT